MSQANAPEIAKEVPDMVPAQISDPVDPAPLQPIETASPAPAEADEPQEPAPAPDPRRGIYERFNRNRQAEAEKYASEPINPDMRPPFLDKPSPTGEQDAGPEQQDQPVAAVAEPAPPAPQPQAPETFQLKVRGNDIRATREQLIQMAGLTPEEADGVPATSLIRAAQMVEGGRSYLTEARAIHSGVRQAARMPSPAPGEFQQPQPGQPSSQDAPTAQVDPRSIVEKIQLGDPEEAAAELSRLLDENRNRTLQEVQEHQAYRRDMDRVTTALTSWQSENQDISSDPAANAVQSMNFVETALDELVTNTGIVTPEQANYLRNNPAKLGEAYRLAMAEGFRLQPVEELLRTSGEKTRQRLNIPRQQQVTSQAQPSVAQPVATQPVYQTPSRQDLKRSLPTQPARSGIAPTEQPKQGTGERRYSDAVRNARRMRGQSVS